MDLGFAIFLFFLAWRLGHSKKEIFSDSEAIRVPGTGSDDIVVKTRVLDLITQGSVISSERVAAFTIAIARSMELPTEQIKEIAWAAFLQDVSKNAIHDAIQRKTGAMTSDEIAIMREHCNHNYKVNQKTPCLRELAEIAYSCHENFNGTGYPRGLKGQEIPLGARIISVASALEVITSDGPYRSAQTPHVAQIEIEHGSGRRFDPEVVAIFLNMPTAIWDDLRSEVKSSPPN